jgi:hypothetical protein
MDPILKLINLIKGWNIVWYDGEHLVTFHTHTKKKQYKNRFQIDLIIELRTWRQFWNPIVQEIPRTSGLSQPSAVCLISTPKSSLGDKKAKLRLGRGKLVATVWCLLLEAYTLIWRNIWTVPADDRFECSNIRIHVKWNDTTFLVCLAV